MTLKQTLATIINRLEEIKQVADDCKNTITATDKRKEQQWQRDTETKAEQLRLANATERKRSTEQKKNLCAQWVIGIGTWGAVMAASIYAGIAAYQLREMKTVATVATKQLELSERPWVYGTISLNGPLTFDEGGAEIPLMVSLRNSGNSPALQTGINAVPVIGYRDINNTTSREQACKGAANLSRSIGIAIFPNTTIGEPWRVTIPYGQIQSANADWERRYPNLHLTDIVSPEVIVCISYRPGFTQALYSTTYAMTLSRLDSKDRPVVLFPMRQNINQKRLVLGFDAITPITAK
jgi:hypothetical protein